MQDVKMTMAARQSRPNKFVSIVIIVFVLIAAGLVVFNFYKPESNAPATTVISQKALEEKYGLRVDLIAVTGAGGFVDVRMKMVDGEKAKLLLTDPKNFPALMIGDVILNAPEATKTQKMRFESNATMYIMYPNSGSLVMQGSPITILFGDTALEPISAR